MGDLYINEFDDDLRHSLKMRALREGILLRDLVIRACRHELRTPAKSTKSAPKLATVEERKANKRAKAKAKPVPPSAEPELVQAAPPSQEA